MYEKILKALRAKAQASLDRIEAIMKARGERDDPSATPEEATELEALRAALDATQKEITDTETQMRSVLASAQVVERDPLLIVARAGDPRPGQGNQVPRIEVPTVKPEKGIGFARLAIAMIRNGNNVQGALATAIQYKQQWGNTPEVETLLRAAVDIGTTTDSDWAAPLVNNTLSNEFIELVRAEAVMGRINGFRRVPFNISFPRQTGAASAGWVGEGLSKPVSRPSFDRVTHPWAKMAGICVFTNELMRFSNPAIEAMVRDDLREAIVTLEDTTFLDNTAASATRPAGLQNIIPAGNEMASTGGTVAQITADLSAMIQLATADGNVLNNPHWIMSPRSAAYLGLVRTTQDLFAFREEMGRGTLLGIPVVVSSRVPVNLGAGAETFIALVSAGDIMVSDDGDTSIDTSTEASIQMDSAPATPPTPLVSFWQQNLVGVKAERFKYWSARRTTTHAWLSSVDY